MPSSEALVETARWILVAATIRVPIKPNPKPRCAPANLERIGWVRTGGAASFPSKDASVFFV